MFTKCVCAAGAIFVLSSLIPGSSAAGETLAKGELNISSPYSGRRLVVPVGSRNVLTPQVVVPVTGYGDPAGGEMSFVANEATDLAFPAPHVWVGEVIAPSFPLGYRTTVSGYLDLAPLLHGIASVERTLILYGLTNASLIEGKEPDTATKNERLIPKHSPCAKWTRPWTPK